jgi:hypothetical protein
MIGMMNSRKQKILIVLLAGMLALLLPACGTGVQVGGSAATERSLVASLTALAEENQAQALVDMTPEPNESTGGSGSDPIEILSIDVENNYPDAITFNLLARAETPIKRVAFFHWLQGQESRELERIAFTPGMEILASYTWDTARITVAPSSPVYFYWELEDEAGNQVVSEEQLVYYDDLRFAWNEINDGELVVRWYEGDQDFGGLIFSTARESLDRMKAVTGKELDFPIFILLYANKADFNSWHFYVEDWVGGQAFTPLGITAQILNPRHDLSWVNAVIPHEIAHLFFYQQVNTNLASWPAWIDEGFAQYFEFNNKNPALMRVEDAARKDALTPLRYLSGSFGHDPDEVRLAYDESLSVVVFLLETWGDSGLQALIEEIRAGATISGALNGAYGVTFEEFEALWLRWLGVPATPRPSPTIVPTFGVIGLPTFMPEGTPTP